MISVWQDDIEPYSFINNRLRASKPLFCHLSPPSLPYTLPIFGWMPVHVRWKRKGDNCILCFFFLHHFIQFLKEKRSLSSFLSLLKIARCWGNEISPLPGIRGLTLKVILLLLEVMVNYGREQGRLCRVSLQY